MAGSPTTLDRRIIGLALPALGALIAEPLYNLTDSAIVGHLGTPSLAALALATAALNVLGWCAGFLEMATVSTVAFRRSAGDNNGAGRAVASAYVISLALSVVLAAALELAAPAIAHLLGGSQSAPVITKAVLYLRIAAVGIPALLVALAGSGHLTGFADTRRPFLIALVANFLNAGLEIGLVYGLHLGIAGSAWGTVAAQWVAAAVFVTYSLRAPLRPRRPRRADLRVLLHDALPLTVRTVALGSALLATTAIAARLGATRLAAHQIAMQIWGMLALALDSLAVPAQVFVSETLGVGDLPRARLVGRRTLQLGLVAGVGVGLITMATAGVVPDVFSPSSTVEHQATLALLVCGLQQPVAAIAFVLDGLVLGASQYKMMRTAMLLALVAFAPLAAATLEVPRLGLIGVWSALLCWLTARALLLGRGWHRVVTGQVAVVVR